MANLTAARTPGQTNHYADAVHEYTDQIVLCLLLILVALAAAYLLGRLESKKFRSLFIPLLLLLVYFRLEHRITEFSLPLVGTIKSEADQAQRYAAKISEIAGQVTKDEEKIKGIADRVGKDSDVIARMVASAKSLQGDIDGLLRKYNSASTRLSEIGNLLDQAVATETRLTTLSDLYTTITLAESDSRTAFDKLREWGADPSFSYRELAVDAANAIQRSAEFTMFGQPLRWELFKIQPEKLWLTDFIVLYREADQRTDVDAPTIKVGIIQYVAGRNEFSERDRLEFLASVLRFDRSLKAVAYAGSSFATISKQDLRPLAIAPMLKWYSDYAFSATDYVAPFDSPPVSYVMPPNPPE